MAGWKISTRFTLAIATSLLSFCILIAWSGHQIAPTWVAISVVALQTLAEIALSPLGLSRIQSLSPAGMTGVMTAMWYLSTSAGGALSGALSFAGLACLLALGLAMTLMMRWFGVLDYDPTTETEISDAGNKTLARSPGDTGIMSSTEL
jgi:dipeptide/tripeptide permease